MKHCILATAGHVDHGKTALIKALTGTDTDRLPEEKARGITIDLGFAHLPLPGFSVGVIDVPGHEDFVRNMIAGIGSVDLALLVVAADDGWMPQTEEHLQILDYLRVPRMIVALTKCDLGAVENRTGEVREELRGTRFAEASIIATSIRNGVGIEALQQTLLAEFSQLQARRDIAKPRLFVDRVFSLRGTGTVVTGTLAGGRFTRGETVAVQPRQMTARIRAVQNHNQAVEVAEAGARIALNLPDLSVEQMARGAIITAVSSAKSATTIDVQLERSGRLPPASRRVKSGALVHVHHGSGRLHARVTLLERDELPPGETEIARLRFTEPTFFFVGDRFIIRDSSEQQTLAGGVVLDADAGRTRFRSAAQRALLQERAPSPYDGTTLLRTLLQRDHVTPGKGLLLKSPCSESELDAAIAQLQAAQVIAPRGEMLVETEWWKKLLARAASAIDAAHQAHADRPGLEISQLRESLSVAQPALFSALLADLYANGFAQTGSAIRRVTHRLALPPNLRPAGDRLRATLAAKPFDPPSRKELAPTADAQQALRFLCQTNEVFPLSEDVLISAAAFAQMKTRIVQVLGEKQSATLSELRQALGSTRRIIVPLLERLDRDGVTIRRGDVRTLR